MFRDGSTGANQLPLDRLRGDLRGKLAGRRAAHPVADQQQLSARLAPTSVAPQIAR